jgi:hypothetical protein
LKTNIEAVKSLIEAALEEVITFMQICINIYLLMYGMCTCTYSIFVCV